MPYGDVEGECLHPKETSIKGILIDERLKGKMFYVCVFCGNVRKEG